MLYDIEARIRMMDGWPGYQQVLTLSNPPIETIAGPEDAHDLARVANDELKKIFEGRPDKSPAWVTSLPLNNVEASLQEMDRAIALGARGLSVIGIVMQLGLVCAWEPDISPDPASSIRKNPCQTVLEPGRLQDRFPWFKSAGTLAMPCTC
jgi:hypothetical protein